MRNEVLGCCDLWGGRYTRVKKRYCMSEVPQQLMLMFATSSTRISPSSLENLEAMMMQLLLLSNDNLCLWLYSPPSRAAIWNQWWSIMTLVSVAQSKTAPFKNKVLRWYHMIAFTGIFWHLEAHMSIFWYLISWFPHLAHDRALLASLFVNSTILLHEQSHTCEIFWSRNE